MTNSKTTPRKIVAVATTLDRLYAVANDGTAWICGGDEWYELPSLPPREDAPSESSEVEQLRAEVSRLKAMHDPSDAAVVSEVESLRADLRRVREVIARFSRAMSTRSLEEIGDELRAINAEPMP